jgi:hypothetical protein
VTTVPVPSAQYEVLQQALADAIYYRDPPLRCPDCETLDGLCPACTTGLFRARAYLALSRELDSVRRSRGLAWVRVGRRGGRGGVRRRRR